MFSASCKTIDAPIPSSSKMPVPFPWYNSKTMGFTRFTTNNKILNTDRIRLALHKLLCRFTPSEWDHLFINTAEFFTFQLRAPFANSIQNWLNFPKFTDIFCRWLSLRNNVKVVVQFVEARKEKKFTQF